MRPRALAVFLLVAACGSSGAKHRAAGFMWIRTGHPERAIPELKSALAYDPADGGVHAALGRLLLKTLPGEALRELDAAYQLGDRSVKSQLAALLVTRAHERERSLPWTVVDDLVRARRLDASSVNDRELADARRFAGVWLWLHGDREGARTMLVGDHALFAALEAPETAPVEDVGRAAKIVLRVELAGRAFALARVYVRRGGRDPGLTELADVVELAELVEPLQRLQGIAEGFFVYGYSGGDAPSGATSIDDLPAWARPTVLRLRGHFGTARTALTEVQNPPPEARRLLALEHALQGDFDGAHALLGNEPGAALAHLSLHDAAGTVAPTELVLEAARDPQFLFVLWRGRIAPVLIAGPAAAGKYAPRVGRILKALDKLPGGDLLLEGVPEDVLRAWRDGPVDDVYARLHFPDEALATLMHAAARDPALGDRLARAYVDGFASAFARGYRVINVYAAVGDADRALAFVDELLAEAPTEEAARRGAEIAARAGNTPRAQLYLEQAESLAIAPGEPSIGLAYVFIEAGDPIAALAAARQALALASDRLRAYQAAHDAAVAAGREPDARRIAAAAAAEFPDDPRRLSDDAAELRTLLARRPGDREVALALAAQSPDDEARAILDEALRWSPVDVRLRARRAALAPAGSPERRRLTASLLVTGLALQNGAGVQALRAFAELVDDPRLAADARREASYIMALGLADAPGIGDH